MVIPAGINSRVNMAVSIMRPGACLLLLLVCLLHDSDASNQDYDEDECTPGQFFSKDCNYCTCAPSGKISLSPCTYKYCGDPEKREVGGEITRNMPGVLGARKSSSSPKREVGGVMTRHRIVEDDPEYLYNTQDFRGLDKDIQIDAQEGKLTDKF